MNRFRRGSALASLVLAAALAVAAQPPEKEAKPEEKWLVDRAVSVEAAGAPVPALRYRLFPRSSDLKDGNAVPLYLRFAHERRDARKKELQEKPAEWNKLPLDKLPLADAKAFLDGYKYNLRQLELGARRKTAEWNYTLDADDPITILLPDAQEMRMQAPLLALQARVAIAEGRHADAVRNLETGFSFSRQVGEGPFLINALVGIACASQFVDCLLELSESPGAPNLYWALAVLPRPLIDLRKPNELEQGMMERQFPDLADLDRPRTPEQWDLVLGRFRVESDRIRKFDRDSKPARPGTRPTEPAGKSPDLPAARKYLAEVVKLPADRLEKMSPAEVLTRYIASYYHELRDEVFKVNYLTFPQSRALNAAANERLKTAPDTEAAELARLFLPAVTKVQLAEVRIARKLAALRAIEALRMHAAASGKLPQRLAEVKIVPVPDDPGTGKPFEYKLEGGTATLTSRLAGEALNATGLRYRVTLRK